VGLFTNSGSEVFSFSLTIVSFVPDPLHAFLRFCVDRAPFNWVWARPFPGSGKLCACRSSTGVFSFVAIMSLSSRPQASVRRMVSYILRLVASCEACFFSDPGVVFSNNPNTHLFAFSLLASSPASRLDATSLLCQRLLASFCRVWRSGSSLFNFFHFFLERLRQQRLERFSRDIHLRPRSVGLP